MSDCPVRELAAGLTRKATIVARSPGVEAEEE